MKNIEVPVQEWNQQYQRLKHATNRSADLERENGRVKRENARLREALRKLVEMLEQTIDECDSPLAAYFPEEIAQARAALEYTDS